MAMSLKALIAESLSVDMDAVTDEARLVEDLHMDEPGACELRAMIADIFDGTDIDPVCCATVATLLEEVVHSEFRDVANSGAKAP